MSRPNAFSKPHNPNHWTSVGLPRDSHSEIQFLLPGDRRLAQRVLDCYFDNLNPHRPVFMRREFMNQIDALYDSLEPDEAKRRVKGDKYKDLSNDAGFLCSVYLVFALGTMAVRNRHVHVSGDDMFEPWPSHEDFYDLALVLKPDLANSISTLQALILLHWYLYCEVRGFSKGNIYLLLTHSAAATRQSSLAPRRKHRTACYRARATSRPIRAGGHFHV